MAAEIIDPLVRPKVILKEQMIKADIWSLGQ